MPHSERLLWIAQQERKSKVPRFKPTPVFPMLRQVCCVCDGVGLIYPGGTSCPVCPPLSPKREVLGSPRGRGWVPVDSLEATLLCADEWRFENRGKEILVYCRLTPYMADNSGHGLTHQEAAVQALYKALGGPREEEELEKNHNE